jgi:hypothetical protein
MKYKTEDCKEDKYWDTCRVEKMGCEGCYFSKNSKKYENDNIYRVDEYLKRKEDNNEHV